MKDLHPMALFRYSVLGPLVTRDHLPRGQLKPLIRELASHEYNIPDSDRRHIGEKTIESWYYAWRRGGIEALTPQIRSDRGQSKLSPDIQQAIVDAKREKPHRSIDQLIVLLEKQDLCAQGEVSRSSVHRLLQQHDLSRPCGAASEPEEFRSFEAQFAGDIWYGDVMHGPSVPVAGRMQKVYLVSLMDDASRLLAHSAFCTGETALDIEGVLKQALLKRGMPTKLVVDQGAAYRSKSLQGICARLGIQLIYCKPYAPEGKGKLERWHLTFRKQFLAELELSRVSDLADLNARLWAWLEQVYHPREHSALDGLSPLQRYQQDLPRIRTLGPFASQLDEMFYHRRKRKVRKDATVTFAGQFVEVPYELAGRSVQLVFDPHTQTPLWVENEDGKRLGEVTPLDKLANNHRQRRKPVSGSSASVPDITTAPSPQTNLVEIAYRDHYGLEPNPSVSQASTGSSTTFQPSPKHKDHD